MNAILTLASKDPRTALTAEGMTSSREEPIVNLSTPKWENYNAYLQSNAWRMKKISSMESGRPMFCWVCEKPMPSLDHKGFNFHHRTYKNVYREKLEDLVLLCRWHHKDLEKIYLDLKHFGEPLEKWTWKYIAMNRHDYGLPSIEESEIGQWIGEMNE